MPVPRPPAGPEFRARYDLDRPLGAGAMGAVWLARDRSLDRLVAAKFLLPDVVGREALARFFEEARALARLEDPAILRLYDAGDLDSCPFLVTEYVDGGSLSDAIRTRSPLPWPLFRRWALALCAAMAHSHERGILHRDLKTDNVLVTADDELRVADFGLARRDARASALTATGLVMGTPAYMAPELLRGERASTGSDLYAGATCLYVMATGRLPFPHADVGRILQAQLADAPPAPRSLRADLPPELGRILLRGLAKDPARRPASFADLHREIAALDLSAKTALPSPPAAGRTIVLSEAVPAASDTATRPPAPLPRNGTEGSSRGRVLRWGFALVGAGILLAFAFVRPEPALELDETGREILADFAAFTWTTPAPVRLSYLLGGEDGRTRILEGDRTATTSHRLEIAGLVPERIHRCVVRGDGRERSFSFRTPPPRLLPGFRGHLFKGALLLRYESNLRGRLRLLTLAPNGAQRSHDLPPGGTQIIPGAGNILSPFVTWELQFGEGSLAAGTLRCASTATPLSGFTEGTTSNTDERGRRPAYAVAPPVWDGDRLFLADSAGGLQAFALPRSEGLDVEEGGDDGPPPVLRRLFVLRPPGQGPPENYRRSCAGLTLLPEEKTLLVFTFQTSGKGREAGILAWHVDPELRTRAWAERTKGLSPGEEPPWIEDPADGWNAPLGPSERRSFFPTAGRPQTTSLRHGREILLPLTGWTVPRLLRYDPTAGEVRAVHAGPDDEMDRSPACVVPRRGERVWVDRAPWIPEKEAWNVSSPLVRRGDRVCLVASRHVQEGGRAAALVSWRLDGEDPRAHFRFRSGQIWVPLDAEGEGIDLVGPATLYSWSGAGTETRPRTRCLRELLPDDPEAYMSGRSLVVEGRTFVTSYSSASSNPLSDAMDLRLHHLREAGEALSAATHGMLCREMNLLGHRGVKFFSRWQKSLVFLSEASCVVAHLESGLANGWVPLSRFRFGALRDDGLLACSTSKGELFVLPVELVGLDGARRRGTRLRPPLPKG